METKTTFHVGDNVYYNLGIPGSGITLFCEILDIRIDSRTDELYAEIKGVTVHETRNVWLKNLFATKEDVIAACQGTIERYKMELMGSTREEMIKKLLQFACTEAITPSEEYTNWAAHEAFMQVAALIGYDLNK